MNLKLNLNFDLYKGTTRLKQWYKEVKAHFTQVQEAHNTLEDAVSTHKTAAIIDHPDKSVTTSKIADEAIGTAQMADGAVTVEKLANNSVTRIKLADDVSGEMDGLKAEHGNLKETVDTHKTAAVLDHPDKSVTTGKIADRSITLGKLSLDIQDEIAKIPEFLYYDVDPVYLSGCKEPLGYELPVDIPVNVLFIIENDTDSSLSEFRSHDDFYTPLSCKIPSGEKRICILLKRASGGAEPQNGYLFVLDDTDTKSLINKETLERKNTDTTLQQNIDTEAVNRQTADNALDGRIAANESRIDAITLEIVDDNHIGNDGTTEVMLPGKILLLNNRDNFSVSTELKIRYEINYESLYPDAIDAKSQTDLTSTESIYWMYVSSQQTGDNFGPDDDYYNFDTVITEAGKMYFKVISFAQHAVDGNIPGEIQVLAVVPPIPTTEAYIRTAETEDWTRLTNENELNAAKSDITALQQEITELQPHITDREIFVMCDGDHDELKIQAALDTVATGGVVYPVTSNGGAVVLTNANTNKGYSPITTYDVVLKVGTSKTLDFRFCDGVMFDNTNPGYNQAIFQLSQYAEIKNLWYFYESPDTCTTESINPTVLYTADYCIVDNCNFDTIQGMNTTTASQYLFRVGQYCKFRNNTLNGISLNNITSSQRGFDFGTDTVVENNLFKNITSSYNGASVFYFRRCYLEKNTFITFDLGGNTFYIASGFANNNRFSATNNTYFRFGGIVKGNTFHTITTANEHDTTFLADSNSNVVDNIFYAITSNNSYALVTVSSNATFSNKMYTITPPSSADMPVVYLNDGVVFKENEVKLKSGTDTAMVVMAEDGSTAVIKDNITNAASIGTYSSTCVVEGNIVGFGA